MMRTVFVLVLVAVCMSMAGWLSFHRGEDGNPTIKINREEIRSDAKTAFDKGREYLKKSQQESAAPDASEPVEQVAQQPQFPTPGYTLPPQGDANSQPTFELPPTEYQAQPQYPQNPAPSTFQYPANN